MIEREIFVRALEIDDDRRRFAFLAQACRGDADLQHRIECLLAEEEHLGSYLETPYGQKGIDRVPVARPGLWVGRYRLGEQVGEGGMGTVWIAEQREPVKRRVALKLIKPGLDTRQVLSRFETERQTLALMDHPNIAKVLDGGMTEGGHPYFVMEYVHGMPITDYCDSAKLPLRERLKLLLQVCRAVQHAHQKGVIHRDLKPSNILVCLYDGVSVPKVIDFGLAKAIHQPLTERTLFTAQGLMLGTPLYMSPEQADLNSVDIDTRTDIYSLGVILYELLTGTTPFEKDRLKNAGFDELRKIIVEEEPETVSQRLAKTLARRARVNRTASDTESKFPGVVKSSIKSYQSFAELDWIAMKALEKERARRYVTVAALAEDIERFLRHDPVEACPPSAAYLVKKLAYKHRGLLTTAAMLATLLIAGIAVSTWAAIVANGAKRQAQAAAAAEQKARQEAERVTQLAIKRESQTTAVLSFLQNHVFRRAESSLFAGREPTFREAVEAALPFLESNFQDQPLLEAGLRVSLGRAFDSLGEWRIGNEQLASAYALYDQQLGPDAPDTLRCGGYLAYSYDHLGRYEDASKLYQNLLEIRQKTQGPHHRDTLWVMQQMANDYIELGRQEQAIALHEQAHALRNAHFPLDDEDTLRSLEWLAIAYLRGGRIDDGFRLYEEFLSRHRDKFGDDHVKTLACLRQMANIYFDFGRSSEGLRRCDEELARVKTLFDPAHRETLRVAQHLADKYFEYGRRAEALKMREDILATWKNTFGPDDLETLMSMQQLANSYGNAGRRHEALHLEEQVLERRRRTLPPDHLDIATSMNHLANHYAALNRHEEALEFREAALDIRTRKLDPQHWQVLTSMRNLARGYSAVGRHEEAIALAEKTLTSHTTQYGSDHRMTFPTRRVLASCYAAAGRYEEALREWQEALPLHRTKFSPSHQDTLAVLKGMAESLIELDRPDEAVPLLDEYLQLSAGQLLDPATVAAAEELRERTLRRRAAGVSP